MFATTQNKSVKTLKKMQKKSFFVFIILTSLRSFVLTNFELFLNTVGIAECDHRECYQSDNTVVAA
jgi:hypothetical protein